MIEYVLNRYTFIFIILFFLQVFSVALNGVLSYFDFVLIVFLVSIYYADEDNFIWMALLFGLFADFVRDGLYGPGVVIFMAFYMIRFRADVVMDMSKAIYRLLLFSGMAYLYSFLSLLITSYPLGVALETALYRTVLNIAAVFIITSVFKGFYSAVKNA